MKIMVQEFCFGLYRCNNEIINRSSFHLPCSHKATFFQTSLSDHCWSSSIDFPVEIVMLSPKQFLQVLYVHHMQISQGSGVQGRLTFLVEVNFLDLVLNTLESMNHP